MKWYQWLILLSAIAVPLIWLVGPWLKKNVFGSVRRTPLNTQTGNISATGGRLTSTGGWIGRNWLALVMVAFFFLVVGPCCYEVVSIPRKIAQDGREFKEALAEIARKATSPADTQQKLPKDEPDAPSPLSRAEMVDWWMRNGPAAGDGWKEIGTELDYHSSGQIGLEPVINTAFWEGYELEVQPLFGTELLGSPFTSHILAGLVSSNDDNQDFELRLGGNRVNRMLIDQQTGLVWLRTMSSSKYGVPEPVKGFGFTIRIVEPKDNPYLVKRKQGSVRFAYQREFRCRAGSGQGLTVRCCTLPFQMIGQATGMPTTVPVDFDIDVTLARLPKSGETTVAETRPNSQDLDRLLVMLELVGDGVVIYERHINEWHVRLSSDKDIRPYLDDPKKYPYGELRFKCGMPVGVHVAIQIGGTRR